MGYKHRDMSNLERRGERLMQAMKKRHSTPERLAANTGIPETTIRKFAHGEQDMLRDELLTIAHRLSVAPSWLAWGENVY